MYVFAYIYIYIFYYEPKRCRNVQICFFHKIFLRLSRDLLEPIEDKKSEAEIPEVVKMMTSQRNDETNFFCYGEMNMKYQEVKSLSNLMMG